MKKVIFIGGTSYSGSTLLDMILANDKKGCSLGEIRALFQPVKKHHTQEIKRLKRQSKNWRDILVGGQKQLYRNLFNLYSDINFFVDSSKDPFWIKNRIKDLNKFGIDYENILIYKTPQELAHSFAKRNRIHNLEKSIVSYYKTYFYLINNFRSIAYKNLVTDSESLKKLCDYLDIKYFKDKKKYWESHLNTFFGNNRARAHTNNLQSRGKEQINDLTKEGTQKLYYNPPSQDRLIKLGDRLENKLDYIFDYIYSRI